jgi:hypothetical protein
MVTTVIVPDVPTSAAIKSCVASQASIAASLATIANVLQKNEPNIAASLSAILALLQAPSVATRLVIGTPWAVKGHITMADIQIANDAIVAWPILDENMDSVVVAGPVGDAYTVEPTNPAWAASFACQVGTATPPGGTEAIPVVLTNALVAQSNSANGGGNFTFTLSDTGGPGGTPLTSAISAPFDIGPDTVATKLAVGTMFVSGSQPVPSAPGP